MAQVNRRSVTNVITLCLAETIPQIEEHGIVIRPTENSPEDHCQELAVELGRSPCWVSAAKKAGMPFFRGRITLSKAIRWMEANPDFRVTQIYQPSSKRQRKLRDSQPHGLRARGTSSRLHGRQIASIAPLGHATIIQEGRAAYG